MMGSGWSDRVGFYGMWIGLVDHVLSRDGVEFCGKVQGQQKGLAWGWVCGI